MEDCLSWEGSYAGAGEQSEESYHLKKEEEEELNHQSRNSPPAHGEDHGESGCPAAHIC